MRKGNIKKQGKTGIYFERFAVSSSWLNNCGVQLFSPLPCDDMTSDLCPHSKDNRAICASKQCSKTPCMWVHASSIRLMPMDIMYASCLPANVIQGSGISQACHTPEHVLQPDLGITQQIPTRHSLYGSSMYPVLI